ncbi:MAG: aldo/keto reductase [Ketobacter sp.]|nr:MAG: aldo/keto reductase [Ketobacter sp.]
MSTRDMPTIIYGTAWKKQRTGDLVQRAYAAGFRGFDTACQPRHYAEPLVGSAFAGLLAQGVSRDSYYLQTKYTPISGQDPDTVPYDPNAPVYEQVLASFEVSLRNLQTRYLDGYILHSPFNVFEQTVEAWRAMESLYHQGKIGRLGISNCYQLDVLQNLYKIAEIKPTLVQNRFYDETGYDIELRRWCREHDIANQSFWTLTANPHLLTHNILVQLAGQYGKAPAQVLFNYLRQRNVTPLTGTRNVEHMTLDLNSFDVNFSADELHQIDLLLEEFATPI